MRRILAPPCLLVIDVVVMLGYPNISTRRDWCC